MPNCSWPDVNDNQMKFDSEKLREIDFLGESGGKALELPWQQGIGIRPSDLCVVLSVLTGLNTFLSKRIKLARSSFKETDLQDVYLQKANLLAANLQKSNLYGANLQGARLTFADLQETDLRYATLQGANLWRTNLQKANFYRANLQRAGLISADLQETDLRQATLQKADLKNANLQKADLYGANLQGVDCDRANLQKVDLGSANLQKALLIDANLQDAQLDEANLNEADLSFSNLKGTHLRYSTFGNAKIRHIDLDKGIPRPAWLPGIIKKTTFNLRRLLEEKNKVCYVRFGWSKKNRQISEIPFHLKAWLRIMCLLWQIEKASDSIFLWRDYPENYYGINIDGARGNALFVRFAKDRDYIESFKDKHPIWAKLWKYSCDYGQSIQLLACWGFLVAFLFGIIYASAPDSFVFHYGAPDPPDMPFLTPFYFSIVTLTTLGFGDVTPMTNLAQLVVMAEVILGYIGLGLLISILANKVARRA